jgi:hypothetical protein
MFRFLGLIFAFASSGNALATPVDTPTESLKVVRILHVQECDNTGACRDLSENAETKDVLELSLRHSHKGGATGLTAYASQSVTAGTLFRSEIRVSTAASRANEFYLYSMLRSGPTLKRHGKIKTITLQDIHAFSPITLNDDPITVNGKTLRAQLMISPAK